MTGIRLQAAGVAFFTIMLLGACSRQPDDRAITSEIQAKLFEDGVLKARDIRVESQKGVVVLSGSVNTELEKASVERLAGQPDGVKQVINQLTVSAPPAVASVAEEAAERASAENNPPPPPRRGREPARTSRRARVTNAAPAPAAASPAPEVSPATTQLAEGTPSPAPAAPAPRQPESFTVPSGTVVTVRMIDSIDSSRSRPGDEFAASLEAPIVVGDRVVVPRGADTRVRLVEAQSAGRMAGRSLLQLELVSLTADGTTYDVQSDYYERRGASRGKRTAQTVGGGAGLGALIGGIAGGGKGAAIGAAIGAGAGTAVQAATHGEQVKVPSETKLEFTLKSPLTVTF